jgi:hypothetical protein
VAWIAEYHLDDLGSPTVLDVSGNGYHIDLAPADAEQVAGGQTGGALGKTGTVMPVMPAGLLTASQTDDRAIMFDALGALTVWWIRWEKDSIGSGVWGVLSISGTSMLGQARRESDNALATRPAAAAPETSVWHNYCLTYSRATGLISIYRDGALVDQAGFAAGTQLATADRINMAEWSASTPAMDNIRIGTHCPDASEVATLAGVPVSATEPVQEAATSLPITVGLAVAASTPTATVAAATTSLPLAFSLAPAGATPTPSVPAATTALPVLIGLAPAAVRPTASVPTASVALPMLLDLDTAASNGEQHDITLTASLAPQSRHTAAPAARTRWTASLGAQP